MKIKYIPMVSNWNATWPINFTEFLSCNVSNCKNNEVTQIKVEISVNIFFSRNCFQIFAKIHNFWADVQLIEFVYVWSFYYC